MMRDAERDACFDPRAEVEYQEGIEAFTQGSYREASAHLIAARGYSKKGLNAELLSALGPRGRI